jgi:hypothetical protein
VAGSGECGDEPPSSGATELVTSYEARNYAFQPVFASFLLG